MKDRKSNDKCGAFIFAVTVSTYAAAMKFGKISNDGQAQTQSSALLDRCTVLSKAFKKER